jgi:hypothetical protein
MTPVSVCLNLSFDLLGDRAFVFKISSQDWELNIEMREEEAALIADARAARWDDRSSLWIGKAAGADTFWSCKDGELTILIGHDEESWDIGFTMPESVIDDLLAEIERERLQPSWPAGKNVVS